MIFAFIPGFIVGLVFRTMGSTANWFDRGFNMALGKRGSR